MFQNMIQNGVFGYNQPITPIYDNNFNPYQTLINVGSYNYNQMMFHPQQPQIQDQNFYPSMMQYNPVSTNPNQSGYVFAPIQPSIQQYPPRQDYYNPFPQFNNRGNYGGFAYNSPPPYFGGYNSGYGMNYRPGYISMQARQDFMHEQVTLAKIKCKITCTIIGKEYVDEEYDEMFNPENPANIKSDKEKETDRLWDDVQRLAYFSQPQIQDQIMYPQKALANFMQACIRNYHEAFDSHSLCEFMEEDYPRLQREFWIAENINKNATRDLSTTYSSKEYNELLAMHRSSNPYINKLLDNSNYDGSNMSENDELGLLDIFRAGRKAIDNMSKPVPDYISSPEVREQRRKFTDELLSQMLQKEERKANEQNFTT